MRNLLLFACSSSSSVAFFTSLRFHRHAALRPPSSFPLALLHASSRRTPASARNLPFTSSASAVCSSSADSCTHASTLPSRGRCSPRRLQDVRRVFDKMPRSDDSLVALCDMRSSGFRPDLLAYRRAVIACAASQNFDLAEQAYALVIKDGFCSDGYVCSGFVDLFSKNGRFDDALRAFWEGATTNVVCWNTIIAGAVRNGENTVALELFYEMVNGFFMPNPFTLSSIMCACAADGKLDAGEKLHAWVIKRDAGADVVAATAVVDMYVKCGEMDAAMKQFSRMPVRNVVSWTTVVSGFVQRDEARDAMVLFKQMLGSDVEINKCTMTSVLLACSKASMAKETDQIHCLIMKKGLLLDSVVKDALISTYAHLGNIQSCQRIFEETDMMRSATTWSAMVCGLALNQNLIESTLLFCRMLREGLRPDKKCCAVLLSAVDCVDFGRQIHTYAIKDSSVHDVLLGSALFTMYSKCGSVVDSYRFFIRMQEKDKVAWTSMISGFAGHGHTSEAFQLFRNMILENMLPDRTTIAAILMACNGKQLLMKGKELHGYALRIGLVIDASLGSALVSMYLQCKDLLAAKSVFVGVLQKDQIMWSSLVSGCAANGYCEESLVELTDMVNAGFKVDQFACSSVLGVCGNLWRPSLGEQLHANVIKACTISYLTVSSALLTLYAKCGRINDSRRVFDETEDADLVMYTSMVDAYAQHGSGVEAMKLFQLMKENGIRPDYVTFVSVLSACSRNGLVEEGLRHFSSMSSDYGIQPGSHHFACVVDLLGRSGRLKEAAELINTMPMKPDLLVWSTLLGACKLHGDVQLGKLAAKKVLELEPQDSGTLISLSNISADMGDWEDVSKIRCSMKGDRTKKEPGWSIT